MSIVAIGTDIVEIERLEKVFEEHDVKFLKKIFTPLEVEESQQKNKMRGAFLASRWAVKEATIKALTPLLQRVYPAPSIEVRKNGLYPVIFLLEPTILPADFDKNYVLHCSISHEQKYAVATVILEKI